MKGTYRDIIARRWPELLERLDAARNPDLFELIETAAPALSVDGIQLGSAYDPVAEAALQARLVPVGAVRATVYGIGNGMLVRTLLQREFLQELDVVVLDFATLRASSEYFDHSDWMEDGRVQLIDGATMKELSVPFAASPADLRLASGAACRVRDLVELELSTPYVNRRLDESSPALLKRLQENEALVAQDGDVADLFGAHVGRTALVVGPSELDEETLRRLRSRAEAEVLIAVEDAAAALIEGNVTPDVIVATEFQETGLAEVVEEHGEALSECLLVYSPALANAALSAWPGERAAAYGPSQRFESLREKHERGELWSAGCDLHAAADLAVRAGVKRVELLAADFSLSEGEEARTSNTWVLDARGEKIPTLPNWKGYLRDLERFIAQHTDVEFLNDRNRGAHIEGTQPTEEPLRA